MLRAFLCLFYYECLSRFRYLHEWLYPFGFFLVVMMLFPLALTPDPHVLQQYVAGFFWISALLANFLSINHIFAADDEDGHLEQSLLSTLPFTLIIIAKLCSHWLFATAPLILITPIASLFFHLQSDALIPLICALLLGTPIFILIGSLCMALTQGLKQQGALLGIMMFILLIPVLIFGITIVQKAEAHLPILGEFAFFAGITVFAITLLPSVIAHTLRLSIDD